MVWYRNPLDLKKIATYRKQCCAVWYNSPIAIKMSTTAKDANVTISITLGDEFISSQLSANEGSITGQKNRISLRNICDKRIMEPIFVNYLYISSAVIYWDVTFKRDNADNSINNFQTFIYTYLILHMLTSCSKVHITWIFHAIYSV